MNDPAPVNTAAAAEAAQSLAALVKRITTLEDRLDILNILAGLPFSSDTGDQEYQNRAYHDDCVMDRDNADDLVIGKAAIVGIIGSDQHRQAIKAGMVHFAGLPHIRIDGARAIATGYLQIIVPVTSGPETALSGYGPSGGFAIWRITANKWELEKSDGCWKVVRRVIRSVPNSKFHELIADGLK
jgi:SnoaL-like domain